MRKFLLGGLITLAVIVTVVAVVLGVVAMNQNQDLVVKDRNIAQLLQRVSDMESDCEEADGDAVASEGDSSETAEAADCSMTKTFTDAGENISIDYNQDWTPGAVFEMQNQFDYDEVTQANGQLATTYKLKMTNGTAELVVEKLLGGVGGMMQELTSSMDYDVISSDIVRINNLPAGTWSYRGYATNCDLGTGSPVAECYDPFFPSIGDSDSAPVVSATGLTAALIPEVDAMVLSIPLN